MIRIDTLKFKIPADFISINKIELFDHVKRIRPPLALIQDKFIFTPRDLPGIKYFEFNRLTNQFIIEISSKILENDYFQLINLNTIERVFKTILKSKIISFNQNEVLNNSTPLRFDVTNNIKVDYEIKSYITLLNVINSSSFSSSRLYKNQAVVLTSNHLTKCKRLRQIIYDKQSELLKLHKNNMPKYFDDFKNILRFETNITSFSNYRKYISTKKDEVKCLYSLLNSKANVNYDVFNYFFPASQNFAFLESVLFSKKSLNEIVKTLGIKSLCSLFDFDFLNIKKFIKNKVKGNVSNYFSIYEQVCAEHLNENALNNKTSLFQEIKYKLKNAA